MGVSGGKVVRIILLQLFKVLVFLVSFPFVVSPSGDLLRGTMGQLA